MEQATAAGFIPVIAPALVKPETMEGTGFLGAHAAEVYRLADDDLYLVGTSEVPLAGFHAGELLDAGELPLRYAGFSSCFRREAGSYGKDTRGIIRVHWFDKVEMFSYVPVDDAADEHQRLLAWEREFMGKLELAYRVIDVAAGDLGSSAARKYDIEAWFPSQQAYRELTSTSNCTTYQSRRLNIRARTAAGNDSGRDPQRHAVRRRAHHRVPARPPPAAGRLGLRAGGAASVARRPRTADASMSPVRLIATDLDGTLLHSDNTVSDRTRSALRAAEEQGLLVAFATGRPPRWLTEVADATGHTGIAVAANGAVLYDLHSGETLAAHTAVHRTHAGDRGRDPRRVPRGPFRRGVRGRLRGRAGLRARLGDQSSARPAGAADDAARGRGS